MQNDQYLCKQDTCTKSSIWALQHTGKKRILLVAAWLVPLGVPPALTTLASSNLNHSVCTYTLKHSVYLRVHCWACHPESQLSSAPPGQHFALMPYGQRSQRSPCLSRLLKALQWSLYNRVARTQAFSFVLHSTTKGAIKICIVHLGDKEGQIKSLLGHLLPPARFLTTLSGWKLHTVKRLA